MEIELLNELELEYFSLADEKPKHGERVFIILKKGVDSGNPTPWVYKQPRNPVIKTDKETMDFAIFQTYKTRPSVFRCKTASRCRTFDENEIICWGRLK